MLTALEIENFKGISTRQRIDFAPLTLLFGPNSAGKSTILQALLYLHEVIARGSADVDRTELGGGVLELGGFARLVHRHETERMIRLRAEFATPRSLEQFGRDLTDFPFPDLDDEVESAWLELTIRYRTTSTFHGPLVERAVIGVNGDTEPLVWLELGASLREGEPLLVRVNLSHPLLVIETSNQLSLLPPHAPDPVTEAWEQLAMPEEVLRQTIQGRDGGFGEVLQSSAGLDDSSEFKDGRLLLAFAIARSRVSALPGIDEPVQVVPFNDIESDREELARLRLMPSTPETEKLTKTLIKSIDTRVRASEQIRVFLEMVVLGTTAQLESFLREAMYIGPLRTIPPRGFLYERSGRITSWADGLAAWDLLLADRLILVERTNLWLKRLGTGCQVVVQHLFDRGADAEELSDGHVDKTVRRLLLDTGTGSLVLPSEVGAGVSQVIPVVVASVVERSGITLVEQPEIHVHPAVQVGLGDLFIDAATGEETRRLLLVETHSEHLLLRVMRRMRETSEGTLSDGMRSVRPTDVSIVLVEKDGARSIARQMPLNERGELVKAWPGGFFEEGLREVL